MKLPTSRYKVFGEGEYGNDHVENLEALKELAARAAVEYVKDGHVVGLGTGSTARYVVLALGELVKAGLTIKGVPTSLGTAKLARQQGIPLIDQDNAWVIDMAGQVDPGSSSSKVEAAHSCEDAAYGKGLTMSVSGGGSDA